ncbi:DUF418 domain-containing protein [Novosphingobium aquae]|uniref:DUF418 domain-containing protein n=1 Tax=Novosphingobium aquae TaxID=3133435 RepID=A0ABU8SAR4_9SPHN
MSADTVAPVAKAARVQSLDVLRGISLLGILMMNITAFGLLGQAYSNPLADGGAEGWNKVAYDVIQIGFEGTMRGIFSLLFGAGIVLLTDRMENAGAGIMAAEIHFRRMLWMMLFGVIHWALLLWYGEILFAYSICGMLLFAPRKLPARTQIIAALLLLACAAAITSYKGNVLLETYATAQFAEQAKAAGTPLTSEQTTAVTEWAEALDHYTPNAESAAGQRALHSGSWWQAVTGQWDSSYEFQWTGAPYWLLFDMIPFMLLGMGLLKLGYLGAGKPARTYGLMMVGGYAVGLLLGWNELHHIYAGNFSPIAFSEADRTYQFSRLAMVIGHLGLALLVIRLGWLKGLQRALAAVGQMALSNYIAQTLICTALFYGFGFGLYGQFERYQLYQVVAAIWLVELVWSPLWLARFRFGPMEWLWRSLTYWERQPMKI